MDQQQQQDDNEIDENEHDRVQERLGRQIRYAAIFSLVFYGIAVVSLAKQIIDTGVTFTINLESTYNFLVSISPWAYLNSFLFLGIPWTWFVICVYRMGRNPWNLRDFEIVEMFLAQPERQPMDRRRG